MCGVPLLFRKEYLMVITDVNQVTYNGDGETTAWPYTFKIIEATDLRLILVRENGARISITSDFYVDTANNTVYYPGYAPGAEPPEADQPPKLQEGEKIEIYREVPVNQLADLGAAWPFKVIENGLDKLTMIAQDVYGWVRRNIINLADDGTWDAKGVPISNVGAPVGVSDAATKDYVDRILTGIILSGNPQCIAVDTVSQLRSAGLDVGQVAVTMGYYDVNDGGAGVYTIRAAQLSDVDDGGGTIVLDNGNVAELIVLDDTIYFRQWGAKENGSADDATAVTNATAYAVAKGISYAKCGGNLKTSASINIRFNFEFNDITYTGTGHALVLDSQNYRRICGRRIITSTGGGLLLTTSTAHCWYNDINIMRVSVTTAVASTSANNNGTLVPTNNVNGIDILPTGGHGVLQNRFQAEIVYSKYGIAINSYIPIGAGGTSDHNNFEGEDIFDVGVAQGNGIAGVNFEIEPDENGYRSYNTITGVTFLHLSVESSTNTGVRIKCGSVRNPSSTLYTIKSIYIKNMRCREMFATAMFLDATGWLDDILIETTSPIYIPQWKLISASYQSVCKVIAPIRNVTEPTYYSHRWSTIGENLCSYQSKTYVEKPISRWMAIEGDVDYSDMCIKYLYDKGANEKYIDCADQFLYVTNRLWVKATATATMKYYFDNSVNDIIVRIDAGKTATLNFMQGGSSSDTVLTLANSTADTEYYKIVNVSGSMTSSNVNNGGFVNPRYIYAFKLEYAASV